MSYDPLLEVVYKRAREQEIKRLQSIKDAEALAKKLASRKGCTKLEGCVYPDGHYGECRNSSRGW